MMMGPLTQSNQGSNSGTAATHDSDPRYVQFQRQSQNPADMTGEGKIIDTPGTFIPFAEMNVPGAAILRAKIGDLLGGAGNQIVATIKPFVPIESLSAGLGTLLLTFDDASTATFHVYQNQIIHMATLDGRQLENTNTHRTDDANLGSDMWDLSTFTGKSLVKMDYTRTNVFTAAPVAMSPYNELGGPPTVINVVTAHGEVIMQVGPGVDTNTASFTGILLDGTNNYFNIVVDLEPDVSLTPQTQTFLLDAASLLAGLTPTEKDLSEIYIKMPFSADYYGWKVDSEAVTITTPYTNVNMTTGSTLAVSTIETGEEVSAGSTSGGIGPVSITFNASGQVPDRPIDTTGDSRLQIHIHLLPDSTTYPALVVTEPYECRSRNVVTFKPIMRGMGPSDSGYLAMIIFGSQGSIDGAPRQWTPIGVYKSSMTEHNMTVSAVVQSLANQGQHLADFPENYGGWVITLDPTVVGWNYVKIAVFLEADASITPGAGLMMSVNAREIG